MSSTPKITFTGHRNCVCDTKDLDDIAAEYPGATWVHGGAIGIDSQVEAYARQHHITTKVIRPDYASFGRSAPLKRNEIIVNEGDFLVACWDGRRYGGTWYTICYARAKGKETILITPIRIAI